MAFRIRFQCETGLDDRLVEPDGGQHVLQRPALGGVIKHVVGGHQRHGRGFGQSCRRLQPEPVVAVIGRRDREADGTRKAMPEAAQQSEGLLLVGGKIGQRRQRHAVAPLPEVVAPEQRFALFGLVAQIGLRQHAAQIPPAGAVPRIGEDVGRAVREDEAAAGMIGQMHRPEGSCRVVLVLDPDEFRCAPGAHRAGDRVAVGQSHAGMAVKAGGDDQFLRPRGAAQEGEIRLRAELDVSRLGRRIAGRLRLHAKTPCRNQRGGSSDRP